MTEKGLSNTQTVELMLRERGVELQPEVLSAVSDIISALMKDVTESVSSLNETIVSLKENISTLSAINKSTNESLTEIVNTMNRRHNEDQAVIAELREKLKRAEAKLGRNSSNSNKPSSWDPFSKPKPSPKRSAILTPSGNKNRKRVSGGQAGHKGTTMKISDSPDNTVNVCPAECSACPHYQQCLEASSVRETRSVVDVVVSTVQTDYLQRVFTCCVSGEEKTGSFPEGVSSRLQYGPMTKAVVTDLSTDGAMSMERIRVFMNTLFGFGMSDGTVRNIIAKGASLGKSVLDKIKDAVSRCHVVHFDETGGRYMGKNAWFHIAATQLFTIYGFSRKRGCEGISPLGVYNMMTDPEQVAVTDFWKSYIKLDGKYPRKHAFCMAHLDRELQDLRDNYGNPACARKMQKLLSQIYVKVQELKEIGITEAPQDFIDEVYEKYDKIVKAALNKYRLPKATGRKGRPAKGRIRALFERFRDYKDGVLMFLTDFEVPASNNRAEKSARSLKSKLKVSGCFRGERGPDDFCIVKSILESARKQGLNHLEILKDLFSGKDIFPSFSV